jgi:hypothetical protein
MMSRSRNGIALLLLVGVAAAAIAVAPAAAFMDPRSGQLSPSVLLVGEWDWALSTGADGKAWSRSVGGVLVQVHLHLRSTWLLQIKDVCSVWGVQL